MVRVEKVDDLTGGQVKVILKGLDGPEIWCQILHGTRVVTHEAKQRWHESNGIIYFTIFNDTDIYEIAIVRGWFFETADRTIAHAYNAARASKFMLLDTIVSNLINFGINDDERNAMKLSRIIPGMDFEAESFSRIQTTTSRQNGTWQHEMLQVLPLPADGGRLERTDGIAFIISKVPRAATKT